MDHAVRAHRDFIEARPWAKSRARLIWTSLLCIPLIALCLYSWVARPEFIWGPSARSVTPQRRDANLRFAMFLLAQRVASFRKTGGSFPASLAAMGETMPGVSLRVLSDSIFELRATENGNSIVYRSDESPSVFLGDAPKSISGGSK